MSKSRKRDWGMRLASNSALAFRLRKGKCHVTSTGTTDGLRVCSNSLTLTTKGTLEELARRRLRNDMALVGDKGD